MLRNSPLPYLENEAAGAKSGAGVAGNAKEGRTQYGLSRWRDCSVFAQVLSLQRLSISLVERVGLLFECLIHIAEVPVKAARPVA